MKEKLTALNFNMKSAYKVLKPLYMNELNGNVKPYYLSRVSREAKTVPSQVSRYCDIGLIRFEKLGRNTMVFLTKYGRVFIKAFMYFVDDKADNEETTK